MFTSKVSGLTHRWGMAILLLSGSSVYAGVLEPHDAVVTDTWKSMQWCGEQREVFREKGESWIVYEAISLKVAIPDSENCERAYADPEKEYTGLFIIRVKYTPPWSRLLEDLKTSCSE